MPRFRNEGPRQFVVELQRDVEPGEVVKASDALAYAAGWVAVDEKKADKPAKGDD